MTTNPPWLPGVWAREVELPDTIPEGSRVYARALLHTLASWMSASDDCVRAHNLKEIAAAADMRTRRANELLNLLVDGGVLRKRKRQAGFTVEWSPVRNAPSRVRRLSTCSDTTPVATQQVAPVETQQVAPAVAQQVNPVAAQQALVPMVPTVPTSALSLHVDLDAAFDKWWVTYGRVGPKKVARERWLKVVRSGVDPDELQAGLERWRAYWDTPGAAAVKWPQGWLTEERWKDEPPQAQKAKPLVGNERGREAVQRVLEAMRQQGVQMTTAKELER